VTDEDLKQLMISYRIAFSGEHPEMVLADLMAFTGFNEISFVHGGTHADIAFREGRRSVFHHIVRMMSAPMESKKPLTATEEEA
jgi:hypothetical protein